MKEKETILIIDDDKNIHKLIEVYLKNEGFHLLQAFDGVEALAILSREDVHLIILDMMMPKMDGMETCMKIRENKNIPIIFLTAKSEDMDLIRGLSIGADDYMTKPFNPLELVARVKSHLRRYMTLQGRGDSGNNKDEIKIGEIRINGKTREVTVGGKEVKLARREFDILELFARNKDIVFSIQQIYEKVWNEAFLGSENTVMVHIRKLREKIEENPKEPKYIKTVWGVGYKLESY
ncbi:response regulator transcription factor [Ammoniphilus sp. CFH 90114]|uniref:response regulator transcription factor n=1 Tax=Ammoniphilus sp. CFH 90114 TaxID=2493665 RepID=UPI00100F5901|nr:response regulator transcription factor [Ammoniphilus sp. CFH 90114]RXT03714.1 response regulator transcription factor [Ammoniphilus sp. CFH 90114]